MIWPSHTSLYINGQTAPSLDSSLPFIFDSDTSLSNILSSTDTTNISIKQIFYRWTYWSFLTLLIPSIQAYIRDDFPDIKPYPKELGAYGIAYDRIPSLSAQIDIDIHITRRRLFQLNDTKQLV